MLKVPAVLYYVYCTFGTVRGITLLVTSDTVSSLFFFYDIPMASKTFFGRLVRRQII